MGNIHTPAHSVQARTRLGFAGQVMEDPRNVLFDAYNGAGTTPQVSTSAITASGGSDAWSLVLSGRSDLDNFTLSGTTSAGANTNALAAAEIVEAWNKSAEANRWGSAEISGNDVVITSVYSGTAYGFVISATGIAGSPSTVSATDAGDLPFGSAVFDEELAALTGWAKSLLSMGAATQPGARGLVKPVASYLKAEVQTLVVSAYATGANNVVRVHDKNTGRTEHIPFTSATSNTATATAIEAALASSTIVTASRASSTVTATAAAKGAPFEIEVLKGSAEATTYTVATTTAATSSQDLLAGIMTYSPVLHDTKTLGTAATAVPANEQGRLQVQGRIAVKYTGTPTRFGKVYVGTGSGEEGQFFTDAGADRILWTRARWTGETGNSLAILYLVPVGL